MPRSRSTPSSTPPKFPLATIAVYGPTTTLATKLVASVIPRYGAESSEMGKWTVSSGDVRNDPVVADQLAAFLREHRVRDTVTHDRIIGCPHEEGIDYPMGRTCPQCPFWAPIDRFTHEPLEPPVATMSPDEVLDELSRDHSRPPLAALESADAHRDALVEPLLAAIDRVLDDPQGTSEEDASLFSYGLYLFAKWREPRAYASVIRWLSLPEEAAFDIGGDILTEDGGRILASVCDGDLEPIKQLILDREAGEYGRGVGVVALAVLAAWLEVPRQPIIEYFEWLSREGLERQPAQVWHDLATVSIDLEAQSLFPFMRAALAEGLIHPQYVGHSDFDAAAAAPPGERLREFREARAPIYDVSDAIGWWGGFQPPEPRRVVKVGRNDPCPCGSGKKYKKCCGA